jgi:hypothetical protein
MALSNLITSGLTIPPAAAVNAGASVRGLALAAANALIPVTYGLDRQPALLLNVLPKAADTTKVLVQCLWGHALDAVDELQLNDRPLPAGTTATHYTGGQSTPDASLVAAFAAQGITYTDTLSGYAFSVVELPTASFDGQLNITARLRGRRVYSRRLDSTAGGSGPHRLADPATWAWSDNPSDCLADWISNPVYGAGEPVDWASVPAAANANDALVGIPDEKRRLIGITLNRDGVSIGTLAESLRLYAGVWLVPGAAGLRLVPDAPDAPTATYSHAAGQIAALDSLQLKDLGDAPTAVEVLYTDTAGTPWRERSVVVPLPGAGITLPMRLSSIRLPGVQRYSQARREAIERLNKLNARSLECALEVFDIGIRHDVADIVQVSHPVGLVAKAMRVTGVQMPGPGRWQLQLREHDLASYSDEVLPAPGTDDTALSIADGPSSNVAGFAGTVTRGRITWQWEPCPDPGYGYTEVRTSDANWGSLSPAPLFRGAATAYAEAVTDAGTYARYARHFGRRGNASAVTATAVATVTSDDLIQAGVLDAVQLVNEAGVGYSLAFPGGSGSYPAGAFVSAQSGRLEVTFSAEFATYNGIDWSSGPDIQLVLRCVLGAAGDEKVAYVRLGGSNTAVIQRPYLGGSGPVPMRLELVSREFPGLGFVGARNLYITARLFATPTSAPSPSPPPPPPPPPSPSGWFVSTWESSVIFTAGESGAPVTEELVAAANEADARGYWLALPPWVLYHRKSFRCNKVRGVRGRSVLVPLDTFDAAATFGGEFILTNRNFTQGFDPATADDCEYRDFGMRIGLQRGISAIGLAGTKRSRFEGLQLTAVRTLVAGKAQPVGALIDFYATNRNGVVYDCDLDNRTGAFGLSGRIGPDGGACFWVRNFRGGTVGQAEEYVSENIEIHGNRMSHMTSDECWSVFGVTGIVRKVRIHDNVFRGAPTIDGVHHASFSSVFPLRFDSGGAVPALDALGATAAVYQVDVYNNDFEVTAALYDVLRIGRAEDANNECHDNKSWNNRYRWIRSAHPVTGPTAVWIAEGSPGGPALNPDVVSAAVKCQDGNFGAAYFKDTSGNTSTDDTVISDGATVNFGFQGFQRLTSPETLGNVYIGVGNCRFVFGGKVESAAHCFFNVRSVVGTNYRCNLPGGSVFYVNESVGGIYGFKDTVGESFGRLVQVEGAAPANVVVGVFNNDAVMSTQVGGAGADDYAVLENNSSTGATIRARNNSTRGSSLAVSAGAGAISRSGNDWNGTTD